MDPGSDLSPPIRQWATHDRPRERLFSQGAAALSDAELLAVLLGNGSVGCDAVATGRALLSRAGSLGQLLADPDHVPRVSGVGPVKRARLVATLELARRALGEGLAQLPRIENPRDSAQYLHARLCHLTHEVFACLFLDARHRVLGYEELFRGTIDGASVYPREVVRACLRHHASAVIFAHNHPTGYKITMDINRLHSTWTGCTIRPYPGGNGHGPSRGDQIPAIRVAQKR